MPPKIKIIEDTKEKPAVHKCEWVNQKGGPCIYNSIEQDKQYCKEHSKYEGIYTKDNIPSLTRCSGCRNLFKPENINIKHCDDCHKRNIGRRKVSSKTNNEDNNIKKEDKAIDNAIVQIKNIVIKNDNESDKNITVKKIITENKDKTSEKCLKCVSDAKENPNFALPNNSYCGKHQSFKNWKELTDAGHIVCKNWIRGCFITIEDGNYKSCVLCRQKAQENDKKVYNLKKEKAFTFNNENNKQKMCFICNSIVIKEELKNDKCNRCHETQQKAEANRARKKSIKINFLL